MDGIAIQAVDLLLVGMGTVFSFLTLLILATSLMSRLLGRFVNQDSSRTFNDTQSPAYPDTSLQANEEQLVTVISAALHKHRSRKR